MQDEESLLTAPRKGDEYPHLAGDKLSARLRPLATTALNTLPLRFAWRYLFARQSVLAVNAAAAIGTVALLLGATVSVVRARQMSSLPDPLVLGAFGAAAVLGFGVYAVIGKLVTRQAGALRTKRLLVAALGLLALGYALYALRPWGDYEAGFGESLMEGVPTLLGAAAAGLATSLGVTLLGAYLLRDSSLNIINLITSISAFGIGVGTAAVILVLSVFNGFEVVIGAMFGKFNAAVKVIPARGKSFAADSIPLANILSQPGITAGAFTLEETAFFEYQGTPAFGKLKGVDSNYTKVSSLASSIIEGSYGMLAGQRSLGVIGLGLRNKLDVNVGDAFEPIQVYAAKRKQRGPLDKPFNVRSVYPKGTFAIQQDYDQQYLFTNLAAVRALLDRPGAASALELATDGSRTDAELASDLQALLGPDYRVLDRLAQDADLLRLMNIEKWLSYIILSLVLLLVSFNLIGGLWLIVLEKQGDLAILKAMGIQRSQIRNIFLGVGILLTSIGILIGIGLALLLYYLQTTHGLVTVPQGLVVSAYPIELRGSDVLVVILTVFVIGLLASVPAVRRATRVDPGEL